MSRRDAVERRPLLRAGLVNDLNSTVGLSVGRPHAVSLSVPGRTKLIGDRPLHKWGRRLTDRDIAAADGGAAPGSAPDRKSSP
jgi:hypothetical protein